VSLELRSVTYRYAGATRVAIRDVDLAIEPGRVVGLVGANESGKSTLCLAAAGLAPVAIGGRLDGRVSIDGLVSTEGRPHDLAQRCGSVFQNPMTQLSGTAATVWEEVAFGPRNLSLPLSDVIDRVDEALAAVAIESLADRDPTRLSGGQAQLVAIAGVLAMRPAYLVLDEPTSQLDPRGTRLVGDAIASLAARTSVGVLLVEHKADLIDRIAHDVAVIADGRIVLMGRSDAVLADDRLGDWGVVPPARVRLARAGQMAGVTVPADEP
jgi:energy-coupling factor transport system ATP-binding protein